MPTQIGQYRFANVSSCVTPMEASKSYKKTSFTVGEDADDSNSFKDIQVTVETPFLRDRDYFILMKVPQDMNYDLVMNIKLVKELSSGNEEVYQFLKQISIQKGGDSSNAYRVVLYEDLDKKVRVAIPESYIFNNPSVRNNIYYDELSKNYYIGQGGTSYSQLINYNDLFMNAAWIREQGDQFAYAEIGFRPVEDNFSKIVLELVRSAEDYNIQANVGGEVEYGRIIPIDKFDFWLYNVANLVDTINPDGILDRIGIQSHPGLLTMINGEEIRVGPSAAYELDVIPITSVGVVATKDTDLFTIDYSYETE